MNSVLRNKIPIGQRVAILRQRIEVLEKQAKANTSLRDKFAGQALVGMRLPWPGDHCEHSNFAHHAADSAYRVADAMLKERSKNHG